MWRRRHIWKTVLTRFQTTCDKSSDIGTFVLDISATNATSSYLKMDDLVRFEAVFSKFTASGKFECIKIKHLFGLLLKATPASLLNSFPLAGKIGLKDGILNM